MGIHIDALAEHGGFGGRLGLREQPDRDSGRAVMEIEDRAMTRFSVETEDDRDFGFAFAQSAKQDASAIRQRTIQL